MIEIKKDILKGIFKQRRPWSKKYDFGHLLVIGGSRLYSGSPALNALAALKTGVDVVTIAAPERAANIIATFSPDMITYPLNGDYLKKKHVKELIGLTEGKTAVVIGGGLCRTEKILNAIIDYLEWLTIPCVIDADAIYAVAKKPSIVDNKPFVITPHSHEFYVLSDVRLSSALSKRVSSARMLASKLKTTILLKGHVDVITDGKRVALNTTGNPFMTKGGTGDTLAGVCGALLARGIDEFISACAAAYINGKAGDIVARRKGESLTADDVVYAIPDVIK